MSRSMLNLRTIHQLALRLEVSERWLGHLADSMDRHVVRTTRRKKSGGTRRIYMPSPHLKAPS